MVKQTESRLNIVFGVRAIMGPVFLRSPVEDRIRSSLVTVLNKTNDHTKCNIISADTCTENQTLCCGTINLIEETESKNSCILDVSPIQLGEDSKENVDSNIPISDFGKCNRKVQTLALPFLLEN